jgi:hypothetical protein
MEDLSPETRARIRRARRFRRLRALKRTLLPKPGGDDQGGGLVPSWLAVRLALGAMLISATVPLAVFITPLVAFPLQALALAFCIRSLQLALGDKGRTLRDLWRRDV